MLYKTRDGKQQVIVAGSYRLSGYDLRTGKEIWWVRRLPWQVKPTPVVADDVVYFVPTPVNPNRASRRLFLLSKKR